MKKTIITYGLIAGVIVTIPMFISIIIGSPDIDFGLGELMGYTVMVVAFSMVFVGIKMVRDKEMQGKISFFQGLATGLLITVIASVMYCGVWELYLAQSDVDFMQTYASTYLAKMKEEGASVDEIAEMKIEMDKMASWYKDPVVRVGITFMEIFPVGLVISLLCAAILTKKDIMPMTT